jgi:hypothetical protein
MRLRYALTDLPIVVLTVVLLIPLLFHLAEIVINFVSSIEP